ncbi:MAG: hypothetical protein GY757_53345 [bacterium]|nr:hypothetical protein [bacterium]
MRKVNNECLTKVTAVESGAIFENLNGLSNKSFHEAGSVCSAKDEPVFTPDI